MTNVSNVSIRPEPHGIGGWLILPMLGTCISPFINLKGIGESLQEIGKPEFSMYIPSLRFFMIAELVVIFGLICAWVYAIVLLFRHKQRYPVLFNGLLLFTLVWGLAEVFIVSVYFEATPDPSEVANVVRGFITCVIWVPYMMRSKRVANTFVK